MVPVQRATNTDSEFVYLNEEEAGTSQEIWKSSCHGYDGEEGISQPLGEEEMELSLYHASVHLSQAQQALEKKTSQERSELRRHFCVEDKDGDIILWNYCLRASGRLFKKVYIVVSHAQRSSRQLDTNFVVEHIIHAEEVYAEVWNEICKSGNIGKWMGQTKWSSEPSK